MSPFERPWAFQVTTPGEAIETVTVDAVERAANSAANVVRLTA
jgi:hypothetical protein